MKYVHPSEMVAGKKYLLVEVKAHPFAPGYIDWPFIYTGHHNDIDWYEIQFIGAARPQVFSVHWVEDGDFKIVEMDAPRVPFSHLSPQCQMILSHLRKGHTITQRSALMDFGIMALPRRVADLKEAGYEIQSVMEHNKLTGQRYARYSLKAEDKAA